jgi:hypothetical protein
VEEGVLCVQNGNRSNLTPAKYGFPTDRLELDRSTLDIRTSVTKTDLLAGRIPSKNLTAPLRSRSRRECGHARVEAALHSRAGSVACNS